MIEPLKSINQAIGGVLMSTIEIVDLQFYIFLTIFDCILFNITNALLQFITFI